MSSYASASAANLPFGLRELKVKVGSGSWLALSPAQTLTANEVVTNAELAGDDVIAAEHSFPTKIEWEVNAGGIPLAAYAAMTGRTISSSGLTPTRTNTMPLAQGDQFPYFVLAGRSVADDGGDVNMVLYKCKLTQTLQGEFRQGEFFVSNLKGVAIPDSGNSNKIADYVQRETTSALPS